MSDPASGGGSSKATRNPSSQFALSFERLTVESLALPWHKLEQIHEQIHEKRRMVEQHTASATDHLRSVAVLNGEIFALEREFSATMSTIVAERSRTQEKIRGLVAEWERTQVLAAGEREAEAEQHHAAELAVAREESSALRKELREKTKMVELLQKRSDDMSTVLKEYHLDAVGPLMQSIQARRQSSTALAGGSGSASAFLVDSGSAGAAGAAGVSSMPAPSSSTAAPLEWTGGSNHRGSVAMPPSPKRHSSVGAAALLGASLESSQSALAGGSWMAPQRTPNDSLREEVLRLQGELAASRRESKLRREELEALRSAKEDLQVVHSAPPAGATALPYAASSAASLSPSEHSIAFYQLHGAAGRSSGRHLLSSTGSGNQLSAARGSVSGGGANDVHPPVSIGLDLGTRRQQQGLAGVHVVNVADGSPAYAAGLRSNDVIVAWGGRVVNVLEDVAHATRILGPCSSLEVKFLRPSARDATDGFTNDDDILTAVVHLDGRLQGPYNARRESFASR